jgi:hypothetical protein
MMLVPYVNNLREFEEFAEKQAVLWIDNWPRHEEWKPFYLGNSVN